MFLVESLDFFLFCFCSVHSPVSRHGQRVLNIQKSGKRDGLVGNPGNAAQHVQDIPDVRVEILDTGHLISAEKPTRFNALVYEFIEKH